MSAKYRLVRRDLEAACRWLDSFDETDQALALMIEHVVEAALAIEHRQSRREDNVIAFPRRTDPCRSGEVTNS